MHLSTTESFVKSDTDNHIKLNGHGQHTNVNGIDYDIPSKSLGNGVAYKKIKTEPEPIIDGPSIELPKNPFARKRPTQSDVPEKMRKKSVDQHEQIEENRKFIDKAHKRGEKKDLHANECDRKEKKEDRRDRRRSRNRSRDRKRDVSSRKQRSRSHSRYDKHSNRTKEKRERSRDRRERSKDKRDHSKDKRNRSRDYRDQHHSHRNEGKRGRDTANDTSNDKRTSKRSKIDINDNIPKEMFHINYEVGKQNDCPDSHPPTKSKSKALSAGGSSNINGKAPLGFSTKCPSPPATNIHLDSEQVTSDCVMSLLPIRMATDVAANVEDGEIYSPINSVNTKSAVAPIIETPVIQSIGPLQLDSSSTFPHSILNPNHPHHHDCLYLKTEISDTPVNDESVDKHAKNSLDEDLLWNDAMAINSPEKHANTTENGSPKEISQVKRERFEKEKEEKEQRKSHKKRVKSSNRRSKEIVIENKTEAYSNLYDDLQISFTPDKESKLNNDISNEQDSINDALFEPLQKSPSPMPVENLISNVSVDEQHTPIDTPALAQELDNQSHESIPSIEISPIAYSESVIKESPSQPDPIDLYCSTGPDTNSEPRIIPKHEITASTETIICNEPKQEISIVSSKGSNASDTITNVVNISTTSTDYQIQMDSNDIMTITLKRRRHKKMNKK